ncbi:MAG: hypothetical protein RR508_01375 [Oscillospiraceae bacterium]
MIAFLETFISFIGIIVLCVFAIRVFKVSCGIAPIAVLSASMIYFTIMGCFNVLRIGGYIYFAICLAAIVYLIITRHKQCGEPLFTSPAFILFCVLGTVLLVYFAVRKPLLFGWDEYSFWGTAARLTSENNMLYSNVEFGWPWAATQKPGFAVLSYLFNFFGTFAPFRMYFAYDLLMISTACAVIGSLSIKKWHIAIPISLIALIMPYMGVYTRQIFFTPAYLSSYADIPMGLLMGGALAAYYHIVNSRKLTQLWALGAVLGAVTLCKDTGLPLAFIAAGIMVVDIIFCHKNKDFTLGKLKGIGAKISVSVSFFAVPVLCFIGWSRYLGTLGVAQGNLGGESNLSPVGLLVNGIKLMLGINDTEITAQYSEKFSTVFSTMISSFAKDKICLFGSGLTLFCFVAILLLCSAVLTKDNTLRKRCVLYGVFSALGFIAYYTFIGFTYVFIFKKDGVNLPDYNRYVGSYYAAMIIGAIALLAIVAANGTRLYDFLTCICILTAGGTLFIFSFYVPKYLSIIDYPAVIYSDSALLEKQCDTIKDVVDKDARIFFVSQNDNGRQWFEYSYALLPNILDYSWGGGRFSAPSVDVGDKPSFKISKDQLAAYLVESECDYLLAQNLDDYFIDSYKTLFSDGCATYTGEPQLYKIELRDGYNIVSKDNIDGEMLQGGSDLVPQKQIRVMPQSEQYLQLIPVFTEAIYE